MTSAVLCTVSVPQWKIREQDPHFTFPLSWAPLSPEVCSVMIPDEVPAHAVSEWSLQLEGSGTYILNLIIVCLKPKRHKEARSPFPFCEWGFLLDRGVGLGKEKGNSWGYVFMDVEFIGRFKKNVSCLGFCSKNPWGLPKKTGGTLDSFILFIHSIMLINNDRHEQPINYHEWNK